MTFTEIVTAICDQLNLTSSDAIARVGRGANRDYKTVTASIGLNVTRRTQVLQAVTLGVQTLTFTGIEKVTAVIDKSTGTDRFLDFLTVEELKLKPIHTDVPKYYAIYRMGAGSVTILMDTLPQEALDLYADGYVLASTLSGSQEPAFPESFHDILVERGLAREYKKKGELVAARESSMAADDLLGDLRLFIAKEAAQDLHSGKMARGSFVSHAVSGGGSSSAINGAASWTQTGLITFDRDPSVPFAVTSGSAVVPNLDADLLDGFHESSFAKLADNEVIVGNWEFDGAVSFDGVVDFDAAVDFNAAVDFDAGVDIAGGSLILPQTTVPAQTAEGSVVWDTDNDLLTVGTGAGRKTMVDLDSTQTISGSKTVSAALNLSSGQLVFPAAQSASAGANTLDDYEEGTWVPALSFGGGVTGLAYSTQTGVYVKIGRLVVCHGRITLTNNGSSSGAAKITGLPFTSLSSGALGLVMCGFYANVTAATTVMGFVDSNATTASLYTGLVDSAAALGESNITDTADLAFTITYYAAS